MIRTSQHKLLIEINCGIGSPLEKLSQIQTGLLDLVGIIDHKESPKEQIQNGLWTLKNLLQEMQINELQAAQIDDCMRENDELKKQFK